MFEIVNVRTLLFKMIIRKGVVISMKNKKLFTGGNKEKMSIIAASVFVLSALTLTGVYFTTKEEPMQEENYIDLAKEEKKVEIVEEKKEEIPKQEVAQIVQVPRNRYVKEGEQDMDADPQFAEAKVQEPVEEVTNVIESKVTNRAKVTFGPDEKLQWPIVGKVLLNYSMDRAIYFPTMQQYRYNPSIVIEAQEGQEITAACDGIVKEISTNAFTGNTVVVDLGDGYELTYGQLTDISLQKGDVVQAGEYIGKVAAPTIYYTEEGCNVYFKMTKDNVPIDPMNYMNE